MLNVNNEKLTASAYKNKSLKANEFKWKQFELPLVNYEINFSLNVYLVFQLACGKVSRKQCNQSVQFILPLGRLELRFMLVVGLIMRCTCRSESHLA